MHPFDPTKPPPPPPPGGEDDLIELTEVVAEPVVEPVDEATAEVVLDFAGGGDDLASLKSPVPPPEEKLAAPPQAPSEESLDDFLASLPALPEDLDISAESPPPTAPLAPDLRRELAGRLSDAELKDLVQQAIQETVERLARELLPPMASEAIDRELVLLKKRLTEPD